MHIKAKTLHFFYAKKHTKWFKIKKKTFGVHVSLILKNSL